MSCQPGCACRGWVSRLPARSDVPSLVDTLLCPTSIFHVAAPRRPRREARSDILTTPIENEETSLMVRELTVMPFPGRCPGRIVCCAREKIKCFVDYPLHVETFLKEHSHVCTPELNKDELVGRKSTCISIFPPDYVAAMPPGAAKPSQQRSKSPKRDDGKRLVSPPDRMQFWSHPRFDTVFGRSE